MSYDLNILCVNQGRATTELPDTIRIYAKPRNQVATDYPKYYGEYCPTMNAVGGIWYYLMSGADQFSSFELCDIGTVDDNYLRKLYPFWFREGDDIDIGVLQLRKEYKQDVLETVRFFLEQSPIQTVIFHSRYQTFEVEKEFIYGTISLARFVELLDNSQILFNTCYVVNDRDI